MDTGLSAVSRYILVTASFVIVIAGMKYAAPLLIPFLLSIFIAVLCLPAIHALKKYGLNQGFSLTVVLLSVLFFGLLLSLIIGGSVNDFSAALPVYQEKLSVFNAQLVDALGVFGFVINDQMLTEYLDAGAIMKMVASIVSGFANVLANSFLIFVTVIFILLESNRFKNKLNAIVGEEKGKIFKAFSEKLRLYMGIKTWMSAITGVLVTLMLWALDVDYPQLWGVLAFLLNYVPNIGSLIAAAPAVLLALIQINIETAVIVVVGYVIINLVIGNVVEPKFLGKELDLSTLVVFLSLVFWGWVLGPVGMVLSVPLTISAKLALDESEETQWLGTLLGR